MRKKLIIVVTTVILIAVFGIFIKKLYFEKQPQKQENVVIKDISSLDIPETPKEYTWQIVGEDEQIINKVKWYKSNIEFGIMPLSGTEYVHHKTFNSVKEEYTYPLYADFTKDLTTDNGWHKTFSSFDVYSGYTDVVLDEHYILGNLLLPTLTNYSFIKMVDNNILIVNYYEHVDDNFLIKHKGSVNYIYPHIKEYRIFISDVITIEKLLDSKVQTSEWMVP